MQQFNASQASDLSRVLPFLKQETLNAQGIGPQGMAEAGSAITGTAAGAGGTGKGLAELFAQRTGQSGNVGTAASDQIARNAQNQVASGSNALSLENVGIKQEQQQAGLSGLQNVQNEEVNNAENMLALSNQGIGAQNSADQATMNEILAPLKAVGSIASGVATATA
jgi:hypothetical protein